MKHRIITTSRDPQAQVRIPNELFQKLEASAMDKGRSLNTEILLRLIETNQKTEIKDRARSKLRHNQRLSGKELMHIIMEADAVDFKPCIKHKQ